MLQFHHHELESFAVRLLEAAGFEPTDAALVAGLLVKADLRGYPSHGVSLISTYRNSVRGGRLNTTVRPRVSRERKLIAVIDADEFIGQVAATEAMTLAIAKATEHGIGIVTLRNPGHLGRLADYVEMAADQGMIGMAFHYVQSDTVAPYGGLEGISGTNPIAFALPSKDRQHIIVDFATSAISSFVLRLKARMGEEISEGVMLDAEGSATTDYRRYQGPPRGALLPFGGHKGSALSLVAQLLGYVLPEASALAE